MKSKGKFIELTEVEKTPHRENRGLKATIFAENLFEFEDDFV